MNGVVPGTSTAAQEEISVGGSGGEGYGEPPLPSPLQSHLQANPPASADVSKI